MLKCHISLLFILLFQFYSIAQTAPCDNTYGSTSDEENLIFQMRFGTIDNAISAINQGKNTRGSSLGCPEIEITYLTADYSIPDLAEIVSVWNEGHKPVIDAYTINCPRIGRYENNMALGGYYAKQAGYYPNLAPLATVGNMMEAQQYTTGTVSDPISIHKGIFGYLHVGILNPCYLGGVVGSSVNDVCDAIPAFCIPYEYGLFEGKEFLIADQSEAHDFYDGGIAYDHGWVGVQMIEGAIEQTDPVLKGRFKNSALLAANWAIEEKTVKNHNYTAKLIWFLAEMYAWSGEGIYKNALNTKLNRSLIPGILMDLDADGNVDNTSPEIAFESLTEIAQLPGRMWDGHNSLPWYNGMNSWAITEAYIAFRDQGDLERAAELKPYAIAMLDNLAWEINTKGIVPDQLGVRDLTYALLIGIWKIAHFESEEHLNWESAAWAMWNSGYFNTYSTHSVCVGLYLIVRSETAYQPLFERASFEDIVTIEMSNKLILYPNPSLTEITVKYANYYSEKRAIKIFNLKGELLEEFENENGSVLLNVSAYSAGTYFISIGEINGSVLLNGQFIVQ